MTIPRYHYRAGANAERRESVKVALDNNGGQPLNPKARRELAQKLNCGPMTVYLDMLFWLAEHSDKALYSFVSYRLKSQRARAKRYDGIDTLTHDELYGLYLETDGICSYCDEVFPRQLLEVEHVVPLYAGGENSLDNITLACYRCNASKSILYERDDGRKWYKIRVPFYKEERKIVLAKTTPDERRKILLAAARQKETE